MCIRDRDKALAAIRESNGIVVNVTDEEIMAAQKMVGMNCGVFGEPAGVTGAAGLKKLCDQGVLCENVAVVSLSLIQIEMCIRDSCRYLLSLAPAKA